MHSFCLHLFSFFNSHDSQVWSFDGVSEFLHFLFTNLELLSNSSSFFPLVAISSSISEILSSFCSSAYVSHRFDYVNLDYDVTVQNIHPGITRILLSSVFSGLPHKFWSVWNRKKNNRNGVYIPLSSIITCIYELLARTLVIKGDRNMFELPHWL
jgi:hypothetical protein